MTQSGKIKFIIEIDETGQPIIKSVGKTPESWKDLVSAIRKLRFIESVIAGGGGE